MDAKTIAGLAQTYQQLREKRLDLDRQARTLWGREKLILDKLIEARVSSGSYDGWLIERDKTDVPRVESWEPFLSYVLSHKALDLFERRLSKSAAMARFNGGDPIPGVVLDEKITYKVERDVE